jgi:hypothetical protein
VELSEWLIAAAESAQHLATRALNASTTTWEECGDAALPSDLCGVYIPLINDDLALHLGLLARRDVCNHLANSLLGMTPDEALDSDEDVFDAVGEIANLVAGDVKDRVRAAGNVTLGVPLALQGKVFPAAGSQSLQGIVRIDERCVWLVLTGTPRKSKR